MDASTKETPPRFWPDTRGRLTSSHVSPWFRVSLMNPLLVPAQITLGFRDDAEKEVILLTLELIVQDFRLSQVAVELNRRKYRTRKGTGWNAASVFELLPRLIDVGPRIFSSQEWADRRQHLFQAIQQ